MQSSDWDRPQFYMPRVKSLSVMEAFDTPEFLETLSLSLPGETFFPRLETLHWRPKSEAGGPGGGGGGDVGAGARRRVVCGRLVRLGSESACVREDTEEKRRK
jgi:hypothetical protein